MLGILLAIILVIFALIPVCMVVASAMILYVRWKAKRAHRKELAKQAVAKKVGLI